VHPHHHPSSSAIFFLPLLITLAFSLVEAFFGWWSGSLALLGDAGHMLLDSSALGMAAFAAWISRKPPSHNHSFGLGRAEVISAWLSSLLMVVAAAVIAFEAIHRLHTPRPVTGNVVITVATLGLFLNMAVAAVLMRGAKSFNTRAALLHVLGDLLGSVAALIAGVVIYFTKWMPIDPLLSIFISVLILFSSVSLLKEALHVLMEGVPAHIDLVTVGNAMATMDHVQSVHDLHIWTLSSGVVILSAHVCLENYEQWGVIRESLSQLLKEKFGIQHITLQPEVQDRVVGHISLP
jgi:cobalt-zinc-cadmium efflux system protein